MYLLVMAFIGLAAFNSQTNLLFWTFGLMAGVLVVSAALSTAMLRGLRIKRLLPDHGAVDEPLIIRYELTNRNWIIPCFGLIITELDGVKGGRLRGRPHGLVLHLGARATVQAEAIGYAARRGAVDFDRVRISTSFPFGILRKSVTFPLPGRVVIYPRLHRIRREMLWDIRSHEPAGTRRSHDTGGSEEFYGLREYRPGDSIKFVDWKHSARTGVLVSRDMTRLTPPKLMIVVDLNRRDWEETHNCERAISFAASLVCEAHLDGFEVGLSVEGVGFPTFPPHHSRWHRTRMLHALGEVDPMARGRQEGMTAVPAGCHWVVIHADGLNRAVGAGQAVHLSHESFDEWRLFADSKTSEPAPGATPEAPVHVPQRHDEAVAWA